VQASERAASGGRTALNFWVDLATAVMFAGLLGSGIIMKWILPPGTCDAPGVKVWLGHSRHWWGDIHFWVAVTMLALMLVHIWLHWGWVVSVWGRLIGPARSPKTWAAAGAMALLIAVPFIIPASYLEIPALAESAEQAVPGTVDAAAGAAPCGVEGLSCDDCPAADDRLFGGACITTLYEEQQQLDSAAEQAGETGAGDA
jgi:hypothetical protein